MVETFTCDTPGWWRKKQGNREECWPVNRAELKRLVALGEDSQRQFKQDIHNADSLASDMVAFSNSAGGQILIGIADDGSLVGLSPEDVIRVNQLISNAATQHMRSPTSPATHNVSVGNRRIVIVLRVAEGIDKPYFDRKGVIWVKAGSDKRRIQSKEELRRLFQEVDLLQADEVVTTANIGELDRSKFARFLEEVYGSSLPTRESKLVQLLQNMNLARYRSLNLAGLLLFGLRPQARKAAFVIKAVAYPGSSIAIDEYRDSEDFTGTLDDMFKGALAFILRSLPKRQVKSINEPGSPIVPRIVFEELLVNALIHRDYLIQAPIRLLVFSDRVEIVSPGTLPNHLTVEKVRAGNSLIRNSILASFAAKGALPYRGLGTGFLRAFEAWENIELIDNREACTFTARVLLVPARKRIPRGKGEAATTSKRVKAGLEGGLIDSSGVSIVGTDAQIVRLLLQDPTASYEELADTIGVSRATITRRIRSLRARGVLHRIGSRKKGHWEVLVGHQ